MSALTHMFCDIDAFCKGFEPIYNGHLLQTRKRQRLRQPRLSLSERMTIITWFHRSGYRTFKDYYTKHVQMHLRGHFPRLVSYNRFVELMPQVLVPLSCYLRCRKGRCTGVAFVDSTPLAVCHNRRIHSHRVFRGVAKRGKTSMGWFFGFKLHLVAGDQGELLGVRLTAGNVDDRRPVPDLAEDLFGKLFGDRGYISKPLHDELWEGGVELITRLRRNMKGRLMPLWDELMLRKRALIEAVNDQLKNISQVEHSRHRSVVGLMVNVVAGLIAYTYQPKKPSLGIVREAGQRPPLLLA